MDEDADGVIKVDQVIDVIELLGTAQAKFSAKSIRQIVETLAKEDLLQVEENIEQSMSLHSDVDDSFSIDAAYDQNLHDLEEAAKSNSDEIKAKDTAMNMNEINSNYDMQDNAKIMNEEVTGDTSENKTLYIFLLQLYIKNSSGIPKHPGGSSSVIFWYLAGTLK